MSASLQEQLQETLGPAYRIERSWPAALIRFPDPSRQFYHPTLLSDGRNFYVTIGSRESDICVMELSKK